MKSWALGIALLGLAAASPASAQDECPSGRPVRLIPTLNPVIGQSPVWMTAGQTTGTKPIAWQGSNHPVQILWIRDLAVKGPVVLTGKIRGGKEKVTFAKVLYGLPLDRFKFDQLGDKPANVKEADLKRYAFHRTYVWFPMAGCYEVTARVGTQQSVLSFKVAQGGD